MWRADVMGSLFPVVQKAIASVEPEEKKEIHCSKNYVLYTYTEIWKVYYACWLVLPSVIDNISTQTDWCNEFLFVGFHIFLKLKLSRGSAS